MSSSGLGQQEWRVYTVERDVGLVVKVVLLCVLVYYLFFSNWITELPRWAESGVQQHRRFAQQMVQTGFLFYAGLNIAGSFVLIGMQRYSLAAIQCTIFGIALLDGMFLAGMMLITGGMESPLYWLYTVLIVRNSISLIAPLLQVLLNVGMLVFCALVGFGDTAIARLDQEPAPELGRAFVLRLVLLLCVAAWCYGLQALLEKQRRSLDEQRELALRREQLQVSGRLAAEIAHQLKNPMTIINNAAFTLQRTVKEGKGTITQQIQIIREEIERSDRLITELMGYAQLVEGRVEKLDVKEELERAILQVFPPAVKYETAIHRDYAPGLPFLLAQRNHLAEVFMNIFQNAREVMNGKGNLWVSTAFGDNFSVVVTIADDGPGIAPEHRDKIFEPYFTTREKGSGLGLAIVKHNTEFYGGRVSVESELGKGTRFILQFPARTLMKLRK